MGARVLDAAQLQHARAGGGHLEHLVEGDDVELAGVGHDARVGAEHAGDVGVDLALVGADGGRERDGGGVRAAAAERRDVLGGAHALESGDQHNGVLVERRADAIGADFEDAGLRVARICDDARLRSRQRDRSMTEIVDGHGTQRTRNPLSGGEEHVHLPRVGLRGHLERVGDQPVGLLAARAEHGDDARALLALGDDALRGALEPPRIGDGRSSELHDDGARHGRAMLEAGAAAIMSRRWIIGLAGCLTIGIVVLVLALSGGDKSHAVLEGGARTATTQARAPRAPRRRRRRAPRRPRSRPAIAGSPPPRRARRHGSSWSASAERRRRRRSCRASPSTSGAASSWSRATANRPSRSPISSARSRAPRAAPATWRR